MIVAPGIELELAVMDQVGGELADVHHLRGAGVFENRAGDRRDRNIQKIGRPVHRIHILMEHAPHVAAFAAQNPLHSQSPRLVINLGVQSLHHLV